MRTHKKIHFSAGQINTHFPYSLFHARSPRLLLFLVPINMKRISGEIRVKPFDEAVKLGVLQDRCNSTGLPVGKCDFENSSGYFEQILTQALWPEITKSKYLRYKAS